MGAIAPVCPITVNRRPVFRRRLATAPALMRLCCQNAIKNAGSTHKPAFALSGSGRVSGSIGRVPRAGGRLCGFGYGCNRSLSVADAWFCAIAVRLCVKTYGLLPVNKPAYGTHHTTQRRITRKYVHVNTQLCILCKLCRWIQAGQQRCVAPTVFNVRDSCLVSLAGVRVLGEALGACQPIRFVRHRATSGGRDS